MTSSKNTTTKAMDLFMGVDPESRKRKRVAQGDIYEYEEQETLYKRSRATTVLSTTTSIAAPVASATTTRATSTVAAAAAVGAITTAPTSTLTSSSSYSTVVTANRTLTVSTTINEGSTTAASKASITAAEAIAAIKAVATTPPSQDVGLHHTAATFASAILKRPHGEETDVQELYREHVKRRKAHKQLDTPPSSSSSAISSATPSLTPPPHTESSSPTTSRSHSSRSTPSQSVRMKLCSASKGNSDTAAPSPSSTISSASPTLSTSPALHSKRPKKSKEGHCDWDIRVIEREQKFLLCIKLNSKEEDAPVGKQERDKQVVDHNFTSEEMPQDPMVPAVAAQDKERKKGLAARSSTEEYIVREGQAMKDCTDPVDNHALGTSIAGQYSRSRAILFKYDDTYCGPRDADGNSPHISTYYKNYREKWPDTLSLEAVGNSSSRSSSSRYSVPVTGSQRIAFPSNNEAEPLQSALSFSHTSRTSYRLPLRHHSAHENNSGTASDSKQDKETTEVNSAISTQQPTGISFAYYGRHHKTDTIVHASDSSSVPTSNNMNGDVKDKIDTITAATILAGLANFSSTEEDEAAATVLASLAHAPSTLTRTSSSVDVVSQKRNGHGDFSDKNAYGNRDRSLPPSKDLATNFSDIKQGDRARRALVPINTNISNINYNFHSDGGYDSSMNVIQSNTSGRSANRRQGNRHHLL